MCPLWGATYIRLMDDLYKVCSTYHLPETAREGNVLVTHY
jgi:hypothetical protein